MSRLYTRNSRGRQPMLGSAPKFSKTKEHPNDTYQLPNGKNKKTYRQQRPVNNRAAAAKRRRADSSSSSELSSLESDTADDASGEDSDEDSDDEDDDLPAVPAPSRSRSLNGTGRSIRSMSRSGFSIAGSTDSMFGDFGALYQEEGDDPNVSPEENRKRFETHIFAESDDDNDEVYQAVDDISDSEDELDVRRIEEQEILAMLSEEENTDADLLLNQIDGLSAYGFGDDSDASGGSIYRFPSSQGSDSGVDATTERRVHFAMDNDRSLFLRMSESPTMTRGLLPSALQEAALANSMAERRSIGLVDDLDDSDLTDDCLPEGALETTPTARPAQREPSPSVSPPSKKSPHRRGPPRGIFIDEGTKTSGILDPSGKFILMTNPHLLGEEFARRYGTSQASSPEAGFAELIEESDAGDPESVDLIRLPSADIMLTSLNSAISDPANLGQAIGPLEAFYPSSTFLFGDFAIDPDELEENFRPVDDTGEDVINLTDVIKFDEDTDDSEGPTSPFFMPPSRELSGLGNVNNEFAYLNNNNVTAFRRNADPTFAALNNTPSFREMELVSSPFATPTPRRKRKPHASPYTSSHYKGVTPVQRMRAPNHPLPSTPEASTPAKRRRIMT
ncbi:hypothetical protein ABEF95_006325 [Exophiala dermatitidis]